MHPSPIRAQVYQLDDPCYHKGELSHKLITRSKNLSVVSQEALHKLQVVSTNGVIPTIKWYPSKMQDSSVNHLPSIQSFVSIRSTPFVEIDDKGGEIVQRYESFYKGER